jgi:hypothetical protein
MRHRRLLQIHPRLTWGLQPGMIWIVLAIVVILWLLSRL